MKPYNETITWITFQIHPQQLTPELWLALGSVVRGLQQLDGVPLPTAEARSVERQLVATGIQARFALDGLAVPIEAIQHRSKNGNEAAGRSKRTEEEAFLRSLEPTTEEPEKRAPPITVDDLRRAHGTIVADHVEYDRPGHWRSGPTGGKPWEGVPAEVIPLFSEELCDWLSSAELAATASDQEHAFALLRTLLAELYLAWIRPFATGHFRVTGSFGALILRRAGMGPAAIHLLAIALHRRSREFNRQVQHASEGKADPTPFLLFALNALGEVLDELHDRLRDLQMRGQWRAQLLELFQEGNDEPTRRQRQILLDLASADEPVPLNRLSEHSPALAKLYAGVSEKTMRRDVDALLSAGVVQRDANGLRVDLTTVLAFKH